MRFAKILYVGETADRKLKKIIRGFREGKITRGVYVVTYAACERDLLDIIPSFMLEAERYQNIKVLGIAYTKAEAIDLAAEIVTDVYDKTSGFDIKGFFG